MKKWKYYSLIDPNKETLGTCYAKDKDEAFAIASRMKQLSLSSFMKLFGIEKI